MVDAAASNPTVDINWERDVCPSDPFMCGRWPQVSGNGNFPIPVDGVSIGAVGNILGNAASLTGLL